MGAAASRGAGRRDRGRGSRRGEARERETRTVQGAQHWWRMAQDNVSRLPWLEVGADPAPAPHAYASRLDLYLREVKEAYQELVDAVLSLGWRARR